MNNQSIPEQNQRRLGMGTWLSIGSPIIAELVSAFNFDWLVIDLEHGITTESSLISIFQAIRNFDIRLVVRVPYVDSALISRVLDWGASGIMIPHVESPSQVITCLNAMRYPPYGQRGYSGSSRVYSYGVNKPKDVRNVAFPLLVVQIESYKGVEHCNAIAEVEGVDVLFVGPSDLELSLLSQSDQKIGYQDALKKVVESAKNHEKQSGILVSNLSETEHFVRLGFSCLAVSSDIGILRNGYQLIINQLNSIHESM
ncbi:HpcH/HpaI aldolase family protein [Spirosoma areae]